ncbi:MAG: hypothetical protein LBJ38_02900, partial [Oscillospiraceae bacterium]|nr:hypothetical protein [Oscillospiraceae bacterium]
EIKSEVPRCVPFFCSNGNDSAQPQIIIAAVSLAERGLQAKEFQMADTWELEPTNAGGGSGKWKALRN